MKSFEQVDQNYAHHESALIVETVEFLRYHPISNIEVYGYGFHQPIKYNSRVAASVTNAMSL
jgi:hypothetical protein